MTKQYINYCRLILMIATVLIVRTTYAAPPDCPGTFTVTKIDDLAFGDYIGDAAGVITVPPTGGRIAPGITLVGGVVTPAKYQLENSDSRCSNKWITITIVTPSISISGPATMIVDNFITSAAADKDKVKTGTSNSVIVTIGADLHTNNPQAQGSYAGGYTFDFSY